MHLAVVCLLAAAASSLVSTVRSTPYEAMDVTNAEDSLMQELYKRLSQMDAGYFKDEERGNGYLQDEVEENGYERDNTIPVEQELWPEDGRVTHKTRSPGQADIRDSEYLEHSSNTAGHNGYIYVTGGAGEGKQHLTPEGLYNNVEQIKSDESLPFYCHPPNPCPKGYTSKDGCQELIEDTAEVQSAWIQRMQEKGMCSCDEEHMFDCRKDQTMVSKLSGDEDDDKATQLDKVINEIINDKSSNPYVGGQKRKSLVAKKSPRAKRNAPVDKMEMELEKLRYRKRSSNPYLSGEKLKTVAKKG